ncbi:alkaline phosphatase family protein [Dyadobacter sediminis]|uniref:Alkaline phosphatase family protein n=2 Tax=Dyadobacter sediminis TaxID=1493691 RepID=A0A5R9KEG5_9BACT|nr:alkaline phosphatase family protein [Dyadobacter sediminis]
MGAAGTSGFQAMNVLLALTFALLSFTHTFAQSRKTENLVVIVLDGMRWQEVFEGADSVLINKPQFTRNKDRIKSRYWNDAINKRREKLMPFFWNTVVSKGVAYGNRNFGNTADVTNPFRLTYPGFSEMLTGFADPAISSNRLVTSKSQNVLEFINRQNAYQGKVAVFATSDLFPFLLDRANSNLYINADSDSLAFLSKEFQLLNEMQRLSNKPTTERPDLLTYFAAREYVKAYKPKVLYLALGETDAFAHQGNYEQYLETAKAEDQMISELWTLLQSMPQYKDKTTLIVTCDHGRGNQIKEQWIGHGALIKDSGEIWIAAMGPDIKASGEAKNKGQLYQAQLAATMAAILGFDFKPETHKAMEPIRSLILK